MTFCGKVGGTLLSRRASFGIFSAMKRRVSTLMICLAEYAKNLLVIQGRALFKNSIASWQSHLRQLEKSASKPN
jgi:hypothetical protein